MFCSRSPLLRPPYHLHFGDPSTRIISPLLNSFHLEDPNTAMVTQPRHAPLLWKPRYTRQMLSFATLQPLTPLCYANPMLCSHTTPLRFRRHQYNRGYVAILCLAWVLFLEHLNKQMNSQSSIPLLPYLCPKSMTRAAEAQHSHDASLVCSVVPLMIASALFFGCDIQN